MAKKNTPEVKTEDKVQKEQNKVQTKYDRKMEARKQQKQKDARQEKIARMTAAAIGIGIVAVIVISIAASFIRKNAALNGAYVKIGDHELTQLEYDYFYETTVANYLNSMSSLLPYMGLDTSRDFADQQYTEDLTWKDMFDEMTVEQIKQTKALVDDAAKAGFTYDTAADYESFATSFQSAAESENVSVGNYYKENFGAYATAKNVEPFVKEGMLASAYYDELLESNAPSEEDIKTYYEENKRTYDKVDYRSFTFTAELGEDAGEEETSAAMDELEVKAQTMLEALQSGGDFDTLCAENASEELKADYEDPETEHSLSEGRYSSSITTVMGDWLYDETRAEGDLTVLRDDASHQYYVVEFVNRYYDEADDARISDTLSSEKVSAYVATLVEGYQVTDIKGELKYLTIPQETAEEEGAEEPDVAPQDENASSDENEEAAE